MECLCALVEHNQGKSVKCSNKVLFKDQLRSFVLDLSVAFENKHSNYPFLSVSLLNPIVSFKAPQQMNTSPRFTFF